MFSSSRKRRARREPQKGPPLVDRALKRLGLLEGVKSQLALRAFTVACGPRLSARARAERFAHGVLYVRVQSSAWANEINFAKEALLLRLREVGGGVVVRDIRFTVGPIEDLPTWSDPPIETPPPPPPVPIDPKVAAALTQVPDDDLRDALGGLYVTACHAGKKA
jgi:hypothetical protein